MKTIVTHIGPDLDAITSIWLIKTFFPNWNEAALAFVPAGKTLSGKDPDIDMEVWHVDTGMGKFDHHQSDVDTCSALLVYEELARSKKENEALKRMLYLVNDIDHFRHVFYPNAKEDYWYISLETQIDGWRLIYADNPVKIVELGLTALDGIYKMFQNKVWAEKEIKENGIEFALPWGKGIGIETVNDEAVTLAQRMGYAIVIRKDPNKGYIRIKALPRQDIDLTSLYNYLKEEEPEATWFLHASHHMILNGSSKNPDMRPSKKMLAEIIELVKQMCK